jgi:hypothetical protein
MRRRPPSRLGSRACNEQTQIRRSRLGTKDGSRANDNERFLDPAFCIAAARALYGDEGTDRMIQERVFARAYAHRGLARDDLEEIRRARGDEAAKTRARELLSSGEARREFYARYSNNLDRPDKHFVLATEPVWITGVCTYFYAAVKPTLGSDYRYVLSAMRIHAKVGSELRRLIAAGIFFACLSPPRQPNKSNKRARIGNPEQLSSFDLAFVRFVSLSSEREEAEKISA